MRAFFDFPAFLRFRHFLRHPIEFLQYDRLAAQASHERDDERALLAFVQSRTRLRIERATAAHAAQSHVGLDHANHFELAKHILHTIGRVWPDGSQPYQPNLRATVAHVLNRETRRYGVTTLHEEDDFGAISHKLFDPGIVSSSEDLRELAVYLLNDRHRLFHGARAFQ